MKHYLLIFTLLLSFLANGVAGAGMGMPCAQPMDAGYSEQMAGHADHAAGKMVNTSGQQCTDCAQPACDNTHACTSCLAHCATALVASVAVPVSRPPSSPIFTLESWHFPSVHSSLLRPPRLS